ncbi:MAG: hypothetical protein Q9181_007813 [Wetmoreana brouardii]
MPQPSDFSNPDLATVRTEAPRSYDGTTLKSKKAKEETEASLNSHSAMDSDEAMKSGTFRRSDEDEEVAAPVAKANNTAHTDGQKTELGLPDRIL